MRSTQLESDQMVAALQMAGKEVEYILFPNEGHSLTHWKNVLVLTRKMEDFLAEHLEIISATLNVEKRAITILVR